MFFYVLRLNVVPVGNDSTKRLFKIGITDDLPRRLEDHKNALIGGYEIINIIEHDYELMTLESRFKSKHLPYHGKEIFLLDEEEVKIVDIGVSITTSVLDRLRPGLCGVCGKPALSMMFHKCRKITEKRSIAKIQKESMFSKVSSGNPNLRSSSDFTPRETITDVSVPKELSNVIPRDSSDEENRSVGNIDLTNVDTKDGVMTKSAFLMFSQRALKLGFITQDVYESIRSCIDSE